MKKHVIKSVVPGSIAEECGFEKGDKLLGINENPIEDTFDYQYLTADDFLVLEVETKQGEIVEIEVEKDPEEDLGLVFENSFMDDYRSCKNKCIFCFIDQMPPGMRQTLYFKDDDTRLSFLQGNYVTLTNLSEEDLNRIIRYRMEPMNVSFQTMNPSLRCKMLNNRFAGDALKKADRLYEAEITMNGQIVLCKGVNDGEELEFSLKKLYEYVPVLQSVSVVPVGLSKFREGLYPLEPFMKEDAKKVIDCIEQWQRKAFKEKKIHFVHASDEWYFLAERPIPEEERYDGYLQLENGVGMVRSFWEDFKDYLKKEFGYTAEIPNMMLTNTDNTQDIDYDRIGRCEKRPHLVDNPYEIRPDMTAESSEKALSGDNANVTAVTAFESADKRTVSLATGVLFAPVLKICAAELMKALPDVSVNVYPIRNDFFGENITVAGLVTGTDLTAQLKDKNIGEALIIPGTMLRFGEEVFLDDITVSQLADALHCRVDIVKSSGDCLAEYFKKFRE